MDTDLAVISEDNDDELKNSVILGIETKVTQLLHNKRLNHVLGQKLLYLAVKNDRVTIAEYLLKHGCKIQNDLPHNELVVAMWQDNVEMIDMLLRNGGDFRIFTYMHVTYLQTFGDFAKLVLAIKVGNNSDAEHLIKKLDLSPRLIEEFHLFAEMRKRTEIANAFKVRFQTIMQKQTGKCL